jgi:hypothetical protein
MVGEVLTLPQLEEGVFIGGGNLAVGGSPSSNPAVSSATPASGPDAPVVGPAGPDCSPGVRWLAGRIRRPAERRFKIAVRRLHRTGPVCRRMVRPGDRPDRTSPLLAGDSTIFLFVHENPFTCELKPVCIHFKY